MTPALRRCAAAAFPAAMFLVSVTWPLLPHAVARPVGSFLSLTCHRLPSRSILLPWGLCGLCARCTAYWLGTAVFILFPPPVARRGVRSLLTGLALLLPLVIDGALQYAGLYESTNVLRVATGLLAGAGTAVLLRGALPASRRVGRSGGSLGRHPRSSLSAGGRASDRSRSRPLFPCPGPRS